MLVFPNILVDLSISSEVPSECASLFFPKPDIRCSYIQNFYILLMNLPFYHHGIMFFFCGNSLLLSLICLILTLPLQVSFYQCFHDVHLKKDFVYLILQREEEREEGREKYINVQEKHRWVASYTPPTRELAHNPGMCPDQESKWWPFSLQMTPNPLSHTSQGCMIYIF